MNKDVYEKDKTKPCFSAYITYSEPQEAALAILACDQF